MSTDSGTAKLDITFKDAAVALGDFLMPRECIVCGRRLGMREKYLCIYCQSQIPYTYQWLLPHNAMADRFNEMIQRDLAHEGGAGKDRDGNSKDDRGQESVERYAWAAALFFYNSETGYRKIPQRLKYDGDLPAGRYFSRLLGEELAKAPHFQDVDMVIPVPLYWRRYWTRGYNQAQIIATVLADCLGADLKTDILFRTRHTRTQTKLSGEEKTRNVASAFAIRPAFLRQFWANQVAPVHILLVDDVFTTGATLNACFHALRTIFPSAVRISIATLGFVSH